MPDKIDPSDIKDRGGRRLLPDRRQKSTPDFFPERRILRHRRSGSDRRSIQNLKIRKRVERRRAFRERVARQMFAPIFSDDKKP